MAPFCVKHILKSNNIMKKRIVVLLMLVAVAILGFTINTYNAGRKCTGSSKCNACENCKYCKYCAKDGGSCGVFK